jgi:hypothetical protein
VDPTGNKFMQLQYSQTALLIFLDGDQVGAGAGCDDAEFIRTVQQLGIDDRLATR